MSDQRNQGSLNEEHRRAGEFGDIASHAHIAGAANGKQDHPSGGETSRRAHEHSQSAYLHAEDPQGLSGNFHHADIAALAHDLWVGRGSPEGSPEEDWFAAAMQLRARASQK